MKFEKKSILGLFVLFILAFSISCVSAEDVATNEIADVAMDSTNNAIAPVADVIEIDDGANLSAVQAKVDSAKAGDTIKFAENGNYDFGQNQNPINVNVTLTFVGNNATINCLNGFFVQAASTTTISGTSFDGFHFKNPSKTWNGRAIEVRGGDNINITNCTFEGEGNAHVYLRGSVGKLLVANCYFNGTTNATTITPAGKGETGTKCVNIMGGNGVKVVNNTFVGTPLDAISVASNSKNILVDGNNITGAYYGIYYGGGLENITTTNNNFTDIRAYGIGLVKSAQTSLIENNTFVIGTLPENGAYKTNAAIFLEQGNTAHGAATQIGDITIKNNNITKASGVPANQTTYAVEILSDGGPLKLNGYFAVNNNTYGDDVTKFIFLDAGWNMDDGNINIPQYSIDTTITPAEDEATLNTGSTLNIQLTGADGTILPGQKVNVNVLKNGTKVGNQTLTTDKFGIISFVNNYAKGNYTVDLSFDGSTYRGGIYTASTGSFTLTSINSTTKITTEIDGIDLVKYFRNESRFELTLTANGAPLANKTVYFNVNSVIYNRTTDANGKASMAINLNAGKYPVSVFFLGDDEYAASVDISEIEVLPIIVDNHNITKYYKNGTQYTIKALDGNGNPVPVGTNVTFNINGVMYTRQAKENGTVTLSINLEPAKYIITAEYNKFLISNEITVLSYIKTSHVDMTTKDRKPFKATILTKDGKSVGAGKKVVFNINGRMYERITDANGVASLNINLIAGKYIITTTYDGLSEGNTVTIRN